MIRVGLLPESKGQAGIFPADPQTLYAQEILRIISQILHVLDEYWSTFEILQMNIETFPGQKRPFITGNMADSAEGHRKPREKSRPGKGVPKISDRNEVINRNTFVL